MEEPSNPYSPFCADLERPHQASHRVRSLYGGTLTMALAAWFVFELVRAPYRPPEDMNSLLGGEKYGLLATMLVAMVIWGFATVSMLQDASLSSEKRVIFACFVLMLGGVFAVLVVAPAWPVIPWYDVLQ